MQRRPTNDAVEAHTDADVDGTADTPAAETAAASVSGGGSGDKSSPSHTAASADAGAAAAPFSCVEVVSDVCTMSFDGEGDGSHGHPAVAPSAAELRTATIRLVVFVFLHVVSLSSVGPGLSRFTLSLMGDDSARASYWIGGVQTASRALNFFSNPAYGVMSDQPSLGRKRFLMLACVGVTLEMLVLGLAGSSAALVFAGLIRGLCDCTVTLASAALMDLSGDPAAYSKNFVWIGVAGGCGIIVGPSVGALVGLSPSLVLPFIVAAGIEGTNFLWLSWFVPETTLIRRRRMRAAADAAANGKVDSAASASAEPVSALSAGPLQSPMESPKVTAVNESEVLAVDAIARAMRDSPHAAATADGSAAFGAGDSRQALPSAPSKVAVTVQTVRPANSASAAAASNGSSVSGGGAEKDKSASGGVGSWQWEQLNPFRTFRILFATPRLTRLALAACLILTSFQVGTVFWLFTQHVFGWSTTQNNMFLGALGALSICAQVVLMPAAIRLVGDEWTMILGGLSQTLCYTLFSVSYTPGMLWFALSVSSFGAVALPAVRGALSAEIHPTAQGQLQGAMSALMTLGGMVGTLIATWSFGLFVSANNNPFGVYFPTAPFAFGAVINAGATLCMFAATRHPRAAVPIDFIARERERRAAAGERPIATAAHAAADAGDATKGTSDDVAVGATRSGGAGDALNLSVSDNGLRVGTTGAPVRGPASDESSALLVAPSA